MKKLEQLVGAPVFRRANGAMRLSDTGDRLMPHAHRIVEANDTALAALHSPDIDGVVRVGLCLENIETRMPEILAGFSRAHPRVTVNINAGDAQDLAAMLTSGTLDIAILTVGGGVVMMNAQPAVVKILGIAIACWAGVNGTDAGLLVESNPL